VPGFTTITGQERPIALLQTFLRNSTLPHALLFTGIAGIGKHAAAKALAMALNCVAYRECAATADACGHCPSCRQILGDSHPDILQVAPRGNTLRIDQIRKLLGLLAMKPHSAKQRVVILTDSHTMNPEAANALLKVLEEPPPHTTLILTALQRSDLLPTILSRCRQISFHPIGEAALADHLIRQGKVEPQIARQAAVMAAGSLDNAGRLAGRSWYREREWVLRASGLMDPEGITSRPVPTALAFSGALSKKKDRVLDMLDVLKIWIRDLIIWPHAPSLIMNTDEAHRLRAVRANLKDGCLLALWTAVEGAQKNIAAKGNLRLTLDIMAISMARSMAGLMMPEGNVQYEKKSRHPV
jgi:DNA polymerase-3 subunit delta'